MVKIVSFDKDINDVNFSSSSNPLHVHFCNSPMFTFRFSISTCKNNNTWRFDIYSLLRDVAERSRLWCRHVSRVSRCPGVIPDIQHLSLIHTYVFSHRHSWPCVDAVEQPPLQRRRASRARYVRGVCALNFPSRTASSLAGSSTLGSLPSHSAAPGYPFHARNGNSRLRRGT